MPVLDNADPFRNYQFEIHEGVNAVSTLAQDAVHEYSCRQIQRINEARRWIDQKKEKQDVISNKENVEITISEDLADGQIAKLDASLKLLGEDDQTLLLASDELEDDEIHIIETTIDTIDANRALQEEYQMQLMLLEQQNKKRLLMAMQEQYEQYHQRKGLNHQTHLHQVDVAKEFKSRYGVYALKKSPVSAAMTQKYSGDFEANLMPKVPVTSASTRHVPATKRQKRRHRPRTQLSEVDISETLIGSNMSPAQADEVEASDHCI